MLIQVDNNRFFQRCMRTGDAVSAKRLRLQSKAQSYNMTDSPAYEKARVMEEVVKKLYF